MGFTGSKGQNPRLMGAVCWDSGANTAVLQVLIRRVDDRVHPRTRNVPVLHGQRQTPAREAARARSARAAARGSRVLD